MNINVIIADRPYRLKIKPTEEETIRRAAKEINDKVKEFQNTYAKDKQDYLAMCALHLAVDKLNFENKLSGGDDGVSDKLSELEGVLDKFMK